MWVPRSLDKCTGVKRTQSVQFVTLTIRPETFSNQANSGPVHPGAATTRGRIPDIAMDNADAIELTVKENADLIELMVKAQLAEIKAKAIKNYAKEATKEARKTKYEAKKKARAALRIAKKAATQKAKQRKAARR